LRTAPRLLQEVKRATDGTDRKHRYRARL
jgi:hypothetical protein